MLSENFTPHKECLHFFLNFYECRFISGVIHRNIFINDFMMFIGGRMENELQAEEGYGKQSD
jgi:hypothetical protein